MSISSYKKTKKKKERGYQLAEQIVIGIWQAIAYGRL